MTAALSDVPDSLIRSDRIRFSKDAVSVPVPSGAPQRGGPPAVQGEAVVDLVQGPDGSVQLIKVRCTCGRVITLHCEYLTDGGSDGETTE